MEVKEIIRIAGEDFPGGLERFFDEKSMKANDDGDTMATAIVQEIIDTYDAGLSDTDQLFAAGNAIFRTLGREWGPGAAGAVEWLQAELRADLEGGK